MKVFAVILSVVTVVCAAEISWQPKTSAELKTIREVCLKAHPLAQDVVEKMMHFEYPDEENIRKAVLCSVKKMELFCSCRGYNAARLAKQFQIEIGASEEALTTIKNCSDENKNESSVDLWAYRGYKCMLDSNVGESMKTFIKKSLLEMHVTA